MYDIKRHIALTKLKDNSLFFKNKSRTCFLLINLFMHFLFCFLLYSIINLFISNNYSFFHSISPFNHMDSFYYFFSYMIFNCSIFLMLIFFIAYISVFFENIVYFFRLLFNKSDYLKLEDVEKELKDIEKNLTIQKYGKIASSPTVSSDELFFIKSKIDNLKNDVSFINTFKQRINEIKKYQPETLENSYIYDIDNHKKLNKEKSDIFNFSDFFIGLILLNNIIIFFNSVNISFNNYSDFNLLFYLSLIAITLFIFISACVLIFSNLKRFFSKSKIEKKMIKRDLEHINKNITLSNIEEVVNSNNIENIYFIEPFFYKIETHLKEQSELLSLKESIKNDIEELNIDDYHKKQELKEQKIKNKKEINII